MKLLRLIVGATLAAFISWCGGAWYGAVYLAPKPEISRVVIQEWEPMTPAFQNSPQCRQICAARCRSARVHAKHKEM